MQAKRPFNPQLNPGRVYSRAAIGAPLPGGSFSSAFNRVQALKSTTLFDPGTNPAIAQDVRRRYDFDDEAWRNVTQTVGTAVGAGIGLSKGIGYAKGLTTAGSAFGPWGTAAGAIAGVIVAAGATISGAYTGYALGGLASPSGLIAAGELVRDVVIGMQTDPLQTAAYTGIQVASTIISHKIFSKFKFKNETFTRLLSNYVGQVASQGITSATGLIDNMDPERLYLLSLAGSTQAQFTGANAVRAALTSAGDDNLDTMEAIKQAYGISEEGYRSYTFTDVRTSFGIDLSIASGQFVDFIGNTLTDPSFWNQRLLNSSKSKLIDDVEKGIKNNLSTYSLRFVSSEADIKRLSNFVINNLDKLDDVNTFNLFLKQFAIDKGNTSSMNKAIYLELMNNALDSLEIPALEAFSTIKTNQATAKGFQELLSKGGKQDIDNEIMNQFANLNLRTSGRDFNIAVNTYSITNNYNKMLNTLASVSGWTDPFEKFLYGTTNFVSSYIKKQKALSKNPMATKDANGMWRVDPEKQEKYFQERYNKLNEERDTLKLEIEELKKQAVMDKANSEERLIYEQRLAEYEIQERVMNENLLALQKLKEQRQTTIIFKSPLGDEHNLVVNESNRNTRQKELEDLSAKPNKTTEEEQYMYYLSDALQQFDNMYADNAIIAQHNYEIRMLRNAGNVLRDAYKVFGDEIRSRFINKGTNDEIVITMYPGTRFRRDAIRLFGISVEESKELWREFNQDKIIRTPWAQEMISKMDGKDSYKENTYRQLNYGTASNYERNLYVEEQLRNNPIMAKLIEDANNMIEQVSQVSMHDRINSIDENDPELRQEIEQRIQTELDRFTKKGQLKNIVQGIDRVFELEEEYEMTLTVQEQLIERLERDIIQRKITPEMKEVVRAEFKTDIEKANGEILLREELITKVDQLLENNPNLNPKQVEVLNTFKDIILKGKQYQDSETPETPGRTYGFGEDGERTEVENETPNDIFNKEYYINRVNKDIENAKAIIHIVLRDKTIDVEDINKVIDFENSLEKTKTDLEVLREGWAVVERNLERMEEVTQSPLNSVIKNQELEGDSTVILKANADMNKELTDIMGVTKLTEEDRFIRGESFVRVIQKNAYDKKQGATKPEFAGEDKDINLYNIINDFSPEEADYYALHEDSSWRDIPLNELNLPKFIQTYRELFDKMTKWVENKEGDPSKNFTDFDVRDQHDFSILYDEISELLNDSVYSLMELGIGEKIVDEYTQDDLAKIEHNLSKLEGYSSKKFRQPGGTTEYTNPIKEFSKFEISINYVHIDKEQTLVEGTDNVYDYKSYNDKKEVPMIDFIMERGSKSEKMDLIYTLYKIYDKGVINGPMSDIMNRAFSSSVEEKPFPSSEEIKDIINNTVIEDGAYTKELHELNGIRNQVAKRFNRLQMNNNTPLFEAMNNTDIMDTLDAFYDILVMGKDTERPSSQGRFNFEHINELLKTDLSKSKYVQELGTKIGNLKAKTTLFNNFTSKYNLTNKQTLQMMDFFDSFKSADIFAFGNDEIESSDGLLVSNQEFNNIMARIMNSGRFDDSPFIKDIVLELTRMRQDIITNERNPYRNVKLNQNYDRELADGIKNLLYDQMSVYREASMNNAYMTEQGVKYFEKGDHRQEMARRLSDKQMSIGTLISTLNSPLTRQTNRNQILGEQLYENDYYTKNVLKQTSTSEETDTRLNVSQLINKGGAMSIRRPETSRDNTRMKSLSSIYYSNENIKILGDDGYYEERNTVNNLTRLDREIDGLLSQIFPEDMYADVIPKNFKLSNQATRQMFYTNLNRFNKNASANDFYEGLKIFETMNVPEELVSKLSKPMDADNIVSLDPDMVKAAIGRTMGILNSPMTYDYDFVTSEQDLNQEVKDTIKNLQTEVDAVRGRYENQITDMLLVDGKEVPKYEILYNALENLPEEYVDSYLAEMGLDPMTEEDWALRTSGEVDYKNPTPILRQLLNYKEKQVTQYEKQLDSINEHFSKQLEFIEKEYGNDPEVLEKKRIEHFIERGRVLKAHEAVQDEILNLETGDLETVYYSEWSTNDSLKGKLDQARQDMITANELIDEKLGEDIEKIQSKIDDLSIMDKEKYNDLRDNAFDFITKNNPEGLIESLSAKYPGQEAFIRDKVTKLYTKYEGLNKDLKGRMEFEQVSFTDDNGKVYTYSIPKRLRTNGNNLRAINRILNDPALSDDLKEQIISGNAPEYVQDYIKEQDIEISREDGFKVFNKETDGFETVEDLYSYYSKIFQSEEYSQLVANKDPDYIRFLENLKYELNDEMFELIMSIEDNMWDYGVQEEHMLSEESKEYQSDMIRARQISNYYSATFADVVKLYTNSSGVIDREAIALHYFNDPNLKLVTIGTGQADKARDTNLRETGPDGLPVVTKIKATDDTPVVQVLDQPSLGDIDELIRLTEEGYSVGFMTEPMYEMANKVSYKSYKLPKALDKAYNAFVRSHKMAAVFDNGFIPEVLSSTIMANMFTEDGIVDPTTAFRYGVDAFNLYNTWHQVQGLKMMDMQSLLQLEHELAQAQIDPASRSHYHHILAGLQEVAEGNELLTEALNKARMANTPKEGVRQLYYLLNNMNNADYTRTLGLQNSLFSKNDFKKDRELLGKNIDISKVDLTLLSETHNFMSHNAVGMENATIREAMNKFMRSNPELQVSEEHMRWLYFQNPEMLQSKNFMNPNNWSTYHLSAANAVNNVGMLHGYLMGKHLYGDNLEQGVAKALNTHFSMVRQDKTDLLAQFIFPYMNSSSHNISFWGSMFNNSSFQRVNYNLMISAWGGWNEKYNPDGTNKYANRLAQQGMVPLGENNFLKVSMHREIFKSFNLAQNPDSGMQSRMNPIIQYAIGELGMGQKREPESVIPFSRAAEYFTGFNERQGLSKYSPSLFGYMQTYEKRNYVPFRNLYKQTYTAQGKYRTPSTNPIQTVRNIQYRMKERYYRR